MGLRDRLGPLCDPCHGNKKVKKLPLDHSLSHENPVECSTKNVEKKAQDDAEPQSRAQWTSPTEFMLTCVGYSVGLGNVWRFPYRCYKSGGGAFLIPYVIMIVLIGIPMLFMEYSFGQYFGIGSLSIFKKVCPMFQGIGIGYVVVNALVCIYYNVIIALTLYYLFGSFQRNLPWATCGHDWNTEQCGETGDSIGNLSALLDSDCNNRVFTAENVTTVVPPINATLCEILQNRSRLNDSTRFSPSDEYFRRELLEIEGHNIENLGPIRWHLCLCLLLAWILVCMFVSRGIKSTGKVAYFTATFPYVMLTVLVVRGVTLEGAAEGILYFVKPDWAKLAEPEVWYAAATQLFYSTNLAWGGMITMASYNAKDHQCFRDAVVINIVSFCTSLYAGFAVFSIIGHMAFKSNQKIEDVIASGPGLAFVVYPEALSLMPLSQLWSALFFFMLFLLGIGSQMVLIETVVTGFVDEFPRLGLNAKVRLLTTVSVAILFFLLAVPQTAKGGMYVLELMDHYSAGLNVLMIAITECVVINWVYGNAKFASHVKEMLGFYPNIWWRMCWKVVSPAIIFAILIFSFVRYSPAKYNGVKYPYWADVIGWILILASIVPIVVIAIYKLVVADGDNFKEKWANATRSQVTGPCSIEEIQEVKKELNTYNEESGADSPMLKDEKLHETDLNDTAAIYPKLPNDRNNASSQI